MRFAIYLLVALLAPASASWFSSDKSEYKGWDASQLQSWLKERNIDVPNGYSKQQLEELVKANWDHGTAWTQEQYNAAQKVFANVKEGSFEAWDESKLRQFLQDQGIVAPSGPKESLVQSAKSAYASYTSATSAYKSRISAATSAISSQASKSAEAAASAVSSAAAQATQSLMRPLDESKDYVYSSWNDNKIRSYLEEKGVIEPKQQSTHEQLLSYMHDAYAKATDPLWEAWSDSYIHEWLVAHGVIQSSYQKKRDELSKKMKLYYYDVEHSVWSTWSDSEAKAWLVDHGIIKSDAEITRDKALKLLQDNYALAVDTVYGGWKDSDMRAWLVDRGYLRSDAQVKRDQLLKLFKDKYHDVSVASASYLTWPDARLRVFLRNHGVSEDALPTSRPDLLHEVRVRFIQIPSRTEAILNKIRESLFSGVEIAEEKVGEILSILGGTSDEVKAEARHAREEVARSAGEAAKSAENVARSLSSEAIKASQKVKNEL